jgi:hypothetical protein
MAENHEHHRFQFNLRTLLAGMLLAAVAAWLITHVRNPYDLLIIAVLIFLFFNNRLPEILRNLRNGPPGGPSFP